MPRFAVPFVLAFLAGTLPAAANVVVTIDKSTQRMSVAVDGATRYTFTVSTGRAGYGTPTGTYHPQRMARTWFSKEYYNSPMPHSIFFHGGYAIHGSYEISRLGGPASHGCVRLHPANAATLYALVQKEGMGNTRIVITGSNPAPSRSAPVEPRPQWSEGPAYRDERQPHPFYQQTPQYQQPSFGSQPYPYGRGW
ncbi:MAG TPA: L,D-transpeptidase [Xanthobacteraceae bacterium]|nr:L,D-transpeptidase [Xanthobacteraceae bacterium]